MLDLMYSLEEEPEYKATLYAWAVILDENASLDPIVHRKEFMVKLIKSGSGQSTSCTPETEPANIASKASFAFSAEPKLYLPWGQPLQMTLDSMDGSDVSVNVFYVEYVPSGCVHIDKTDTPVTGSGNPLQMSVSYAKMIEVNDSINAPYIRLRFHNQAGVSYITNSYLFMVLPSQTVVEANNNAYIHGADPCYQFVDSLATNQGTTIQAVSGKYLINLADYSEPLSAGA